MDLLERYLYEVGRRLPAKQRDDIIKELRSLLMDALEAKTEGKPPTEEDTAAVLKEFGKPEKVAARYIGEQYVIGPRLYPVYKLVLLITAAALALGLLVSMIVGYVFEPVSVSDIINGIINGITKFITSLFSALLSAVGSITIVFWIGERFMSKKDDATSENGENWNPRNLPPVPKRQDGWKPLDSIVTIVFAVIGLVLFNAFPDLISIYMSDGSGVWHHFPVLANNALAAYLPYWNIGLALTIALHATLLAQGRWRFGTNIAHIGIQAFNIVVLALMIAGPKLLNTEGVMISTDATQAFSKVLSIFNAQFYWIFILGIIGSAVEIGKSVYRIVRDRP